MKKGSLSVPKWVRIVVPSILLVTWIALGSIGGPYFGKIGDVASNDQSTFLPASAESTKVSNEITKFQSEKTIPAIIVFSKDGAVLPDSTVTKIKDETAKLSAMPEIHGDVSPPITSDDGKAVMVVLRTDQGVDTKAFNPELKKNIDAATIPADYHVAGPVGYLADLTKAFSGIDGILLGVALAIVFVILLIVYRSPLLPFIVLFNSIMALSAAILVVYYLAKADILVLNGQVQGILFILVIGAATDYALLYTARYREEFAKHARPYQAIIASWKRSFEPILAAGSTVSIGLLCLLLSDLNSNKALGPVGAIGIGFAVLTALTLLPSLLLLFGRAAFWPRIPNAKTAVKTGGLWKNIAEFVGKHARPVWIITSVILLVASTAVVTLKADGVSQDKLILGYSEAGEGQKIIDAHFPGGSGTPAQIIAPASSLNAVTNKLETLHGVDSVSVIATGTSAGEMPLGKKANELKQTITTKAAEQLASQKAAVRQQIEASTPGAPPEVIDQIYNQAVAAMPSAETIAASAYPFKDAAPKVVDGEVLISATLTNPAYSTEARETIVDLRAQLHEVDSAVKIGGITATQLDVQTGAKHDQAVVIPTVLTVITIILMLLLRSILAPLLLLATTVLSFTATLGISALVFNHIMQLPGAEPSVILYAFIFLVALGIDYNIFLMTRVREESLRIGTRKGVLLGLAVTGSVITSAGIVLAATFAALAVIPILFLLQMAFIVAFGVLLDTTVVRSLLVPALVYDIGKRVWWPSQRHKKD